MDLPTFRPATAQRNRSDAVSARRAGSTDVSSPAVTGYESRVVDLHALPIPARTFRRGLSVVAAGR